MIVDPDLRRALMGLKRIFKSRRRTVIQRLKGRWL